MKEFKNLDNVTILAIETSCDETSVAVVKNGKEVQRIVGFVPKEQIKSKIKAHL